MDGYFLKQGEALLTNKRYAYHTTITIFKLR
jgi:hypothetical protein